MPRDTILIVEDERIIRKNLRLLLEAEGYEVCEARNGEEGVTSFVTLRPHLVLLDVMMPKKNGLQACSEMRAHDPLVPILFLTSVVTETTQLKAYGVGADDYIDKATNPDLIIAKVSAALRRSSAAKAQSRESCRCVQLGRIKVDLAHLCVDDGASHHEDLTKTEALIFMALEQKRGEYVSSDSLFTAVHGPDYCGDPTKIRNHISTLRRKLGVARDMIVNNPNAGYMLVE